MIPRSTLNSAAKLSEFDDLTNHYTLYKVRARMQRSPTGSRILSDQPRIQNLDFTKFASLKPNTLGHQYYQFMSSHKFNPNDRPLVKPIDDYELAYIKQRYKEIHDLIHVLLDETHISLLSEMKVKYFEMANLQLPVRLSELLSGCDFRTNSA